MTDTENKCTEIFKILSKKPEYVSCLKTKIFHNLESLNIRFKFAEGAREEKLRNTMWSSEEARQAFIEETKDGYWTLSYIHFDCSATSFLPNERLYWFELAEGEYEKIVDSLYNILTGSAPE